MTTSSELDLRASADRAATARLVDAELQAFVRGQRDRDRHPGIDPLRRSLWDGLLDHLGRLLAGGKRIRPVFCRLGWLGADGDPDDPAVVRAGAALELLHAFALVHDDLIDGSDVRRTLPTVHRSQAGLHEARGWSGDPERFGAAMAVLAGDLCLGMFHELLDRSGAAPERLAAARRLMTDAFRELVLGQYLDVLGEAVADRTVAAAEAVNCFKTAKYTIERPLHLGAVLTGVGPELLAHYTRYALPLGQAFQLRDDVLGVFGDAAELGKPVADDLRTGKATVLLARTAALAGPPQLRVLARWMGAADLDDEGVARLRDVVVGTGALAATERTITELAGTAVAEARVMPVAGPVRDALAEMVTVVTERSA